MSANNQKDIYVLAPEGGNNVERQQPEVSNPTTGDNATDEDSFPTWDGGGYRGRTTVPVTAGGFKPKQGSTNGPKTVKDDKSTKP